MRAVDVAVIGGGVIGAACARAAALRGLAVGIFEPGPDPAAASPASAGMLAAQIEPLDNGLVALAVRSRDQYQRLAAELRDTTGIDIGCWAGELRGLPRPRPVGAVRGQMAAVPWPGGPPAILYRDHCYVLARGGAALLGSTMERAGFDSRVTNEGLAQIFRGAARLLPRLETQPVERMWAGLRPGTPDGRPILGSDPDVQRLWYATGHGRNGVLLASLTGEITGDLLARGDTDVDIAPLRVDRFE